MSGNLGLNNGWFGNALPQNSFFQQKGGVAGKSYLTTGYSSLFNGQLRMDPSIRRIQEEYMAKNNNLSNQLGESSRNINTGLSDLAGRYSGNQSAYMRARVNPLEQQLTEREGSLKRSLGMRGISGSSFGDQAVTNFNIDKNRALGDARAQAIQEGLAAELGINAQKMSNIFNTATQQVAMNNGNLQAGAQRLQQELAGLGLSQGQINSMLESWMAQQGFAQGERKQIADTSLSASKMSMGGGGGIS